jgi:hypothetical protein
MWFVPGVRRSTSFADPGTTQHTARLDVRSEGSMNAWLIVAAILMQAAAPMLRGAEWTELCPGVDYAQFVAPMRSTKEDSKITVVRVDPERARMRVLSSVELGLPHPLRAVKWAERYDLAVVINAGMFGTDSRHLGYMRMRPGHVNNGVVRADYKSVLVFKPRESGLREAALLDLEQASIRDLSAKYEGIVQNLRIVRSPGKVVWAPATRKWSEAALGMDRSGRLLFIFCRSPYSMHELGHCLLKLPLELVAAQHLEGGGAAALAIRTPRLNQVLFGGYETTPEGRETEQGNEGAPLPNVLAISSCR